MGRNAKIEKLEKRISKIEDRMQVLESRFDDLQNSLTSGVFKYLEKRTIQRGLTAKRATPRLEDWVKKKYGEGYSQLPPNKQKKIENEWRDIKLLYIGQAFGQTLRERIQQEHPAYECVFDYQKKHSDVGIVVMLGVVEKSTVEKLTQQLFDDIECCLVFCNQPLCNTSCKESYSGRDLKVINTGHPYPLKEECLCSKA